MALSKAQLIDLYLQKKLSAAEIGKLLNCSEQKVHYWLAKFDIPKRSISDAIYARHNPNGDPFVWKTPKNPYEAELKGIGLGLYWGEGTKRNGTSLKLGNTDPRLIKKYIEFLRVICGVDAQKIRFSLQIFSDTNPQKAKAFWCKELAISPLQFSKKITITPSRGQGTYKNKNQTGVLIVYVHNKKLRDIICNILQNTA